MRTNRNLLSLLSALPERYREELVSFLTFSERDGARSKDDVTEELLVTLAFFNASNFRPN